MELLRLLFLRWGDPGRQVGHHQVTCSLPRSCRGEDRKDKSEEKNLTGQDKDSLVGEERGGELTMQKQSFTTSRPTLSRSQNNGYFGKT